MPGARVVVGAVLAAPFLLSCNRSERGRVSVHEDTPGDKVSHGMYTADLAAASDQFAQELVRDIRARLSKEWGAYRVTLVVGDISNKSGDMPTSDIELIRARMLDTLFHDEHFRNNVQLVEG